MKMCAHLSSFLNNKQLLVKIYDRSYCKSNFLAAFPKSLHRARGQITGILCGPYCTQCYIFGENLAKVLRVEGGVVCWGGSFLYCRTSHEYVITIEQLGPYLS
uniref:Uncharacterized protein n=1 Tax=Pyxicephalus adspersus TaxID=30357 RepID=A0AAV3A3I0_PYXAD|nr:TPA: hypothetical protein GDO54_004017 [Pyxicephalus adspersus]